MASLRTSLFGPEQYSAKASVKKTSIAALTNSWRVASFPSIIPNTRRSSSLLRFSSEIS